MAPHLGVRVTESGSRSFIVVRRRPGKLNPDTHVIGKFPAVELKDARAAVPAILEMLSEGKIPREVEAERRRVADTFGAAVADAIAERRKKATGEPMPPWVLHDLRRTVRTRLVSDLGIEAYIAERVIGHALPGLHALYDQGSHRDQKRDALDRWADALAVIVGAAPPPEGAAVVPPAEVERARRRRRA